MNKEKKLNQLKEELASFKIASTIPETKDDGSDVETSFITDLPSCSNGGTTEHPFNRQISIQTTSSGSQDSMQDQDLEWDGNLSYLKLENLGFETDSNPSKSSNKNCQKPQIQKKKLMWWKVGKKKSIK